MARIRSIKPEFWESERLGKCSVLARLSFVGLISQADDEGRGRGDVGYLRGRIHPYSSDIKIDDFGNALKELDGRFVRFYEANECRYYQVLGWKEHQKIESPTTSKHPPADNPGNPRGEVAEAYPLEGKGRDRKGMEGISSNGETPPEPIPLPEGLAKIMPSLKRVRLKNPGELYGSWSNAYPDVDICKAILACEAWGVSKNVTRSEVGWARTLNKWLSEEQDKTKGKTNGSNFAPAWKK